jgi:hypothetical protein
MTIGASQVGPRLRSILKDRVRVEFGDLCRQVYERPYSDLRPIQRMIVESELVDLGWRKRGGESVWAPER